MNKSKQLERFLAEVFKKIPEVVDVVENGFGWGTDYGADLIVTIKSSIGNLDFENRIIVQVKSFEGEVTDLDAVKQVKKGIKTYDGTAGMLITTGERTEQLEGAILKTSNEIDRPIDLLAGDDVAKFVIKNAPEMLFDLEMNRIA